MKHRNQILALTLTVICCLCNSALGNIEFIFGADHLEAIRFTADTDFAVTSAGNDSSIALVLKDVYSTPTSIPGYNVLDGQVFSNAVATLNGSISSDASWFATFVDGVPAFPDGIYIEDTDILILYQFSAYDPYSSPWSLTIGDTITIESGLIWDISDLNIPNPDNLSDQITAQIFASSFPIAFTDEQTLAVVPEPKMIGLYLGISAVILASLKKRKCQSR